MNAGQPIQKPQQSTGHWTGITNIKWNWRWRNKTVVTVGDQHEKSFQSYLHFKCIWNQFFVNAEILIFHTWIECERPVLAFSVLCCLAVTAAMATDTPPVHRCKNQRKKNFCLSFNICLSIRLAGVSVYSALRLPVGRPDWSVGLFMLRMVKRLH